MAEYLSELCSRELFRALANQLEMGKMQALNRATNMVSKASARQDARNTCYIITFAWLHVLCTANFV